MPSPHLTSTAPCEGSPAKAGAALSPSVGGGGTASKDGCAAPGRLRRFFGLRLERRRAAARLLSLRRGDALRLESRRNIRWSSPVRARAFVRVCVCIWGWWWAAATEVWVKIARACARTHERGGRAPRVPCRSRPLPLPPAVPATPQCLLATRWRAHRPRQHLCKCTTAATARRSRCKAALAVIIRHHACSRRAALCIFLSAGDGPLRQRAAKTSSSSKHSLRQQAGRRAGRVGGQGAWAVMAEHALTEFVCGWADGQASGRLGCGRQGKREEARQDRISSVWRQQQQGVQGAMVQPCTPTHVCGRQLAIEV